jgi:hypothetical protein
MIKKILNDIKSGIKYEELNKNLQNRKRNMNKISNLR